MRPYSANKFQPLLDQLSDYIEPHIMDRGLGYYHNGQVNDLNVGKEWIEASVTGRHGDYHVRINKDYFAHSECNCPYHDYCKHMAAVVYEIVMGEYKEMLDESGDKRDSESINDLLVTLQNIDQRDLLAIIQHLMENNEKNSQLVQQYLHEREQSSQLQKMKAQYVSWEKAIDFQDREVPTILQDCENLFEEEEIHNHYSYRYHDEEELCWNFTPGIERLNRWGDELEELIEQRNWNLGIAGYIVTLEKMKNWILKFQEESDWGYEESELDQAYDQWEMRLILELEELISKKKNLKEMNQLLEHVLEYIFRKTRDAEDIVSWFPIWSESVTNTDQLSKVQKYIEKIIPKLTQMQVISAETDEAEVIQCWVHVCLRFGQEQKAIDAARKIKGFKLSLVTYFARYYEGTGQWQKAKANVEKILDSVPPHQSKNYMEWIINLCHLSNEGELEQNWRVKMLIQFPSLQLFKECSNAISVQNERSLKSKEWLSIIRSNKQNRETCIEILLHLGEVKEAWEEFTKGKYSPDWLPPSIHGLFKRIVETDPHLLIPVYQGYIQSYIQVKKRPAYKQAAFWLKGLKRVYEQSGQDTEWTGYYETLLNDYRRFPALIEEIRNSL